MVSQEQGHNQTFENEGAAGRGGLEISEGFNPVAFHRRLYKVPIYLLVQGEGAGFLTRKSSPSGYASAHEPLND